MKTLFFCFFLSLVFCKITIGQGVDLNQTINVVLDARCKPFCDFTRIVTSTTLPPIPAPGDELAEKRFADLRELMWRRISGVNICINGNNKKETLEAIAELKKIRKWLLKNPDYTNLILSFYIDENVSLAVIAAVSSDCISSAEGRDINLELSQGALPASVLHVADRFSPNSSALGNYKHANNLNRPESLFELADLLSQESGELIDARPAVLLTHTYPASLIMYSSQAAGVAYMTRVLMDYAIKGGDLNGDEKSFRSDFPKRMPELAGTIEPFSHMKVQVGMYVALLENVRRRKSRQKP